MHLRILCFGASITAGLNQAGKYFYPYSTQLSARLNEAFPSIQFTVDVDGIGGDSVTRGHYLQRMNNDIHHANPPYDWVIVQAGGNDLDFPESAETIVEKIASVWSVALNAGANVLALTVTEHASVKAAENEKMQMINTLVSNHKENGYYVADTAKALPWAAMSVANRKKFRDDNVHFTRAGYVLLGDTIADRLIQLIKEHSTTGQNAKLLDDPKPASASGQYTKIHDAPKPTTCLSCNDPVVVFTTVEVTLPYGATSAA